MIVHEVAQRSVEWYQVRSGIATASNFHKIVTPTGKLSSQADEYCNRLLSELFIDPMADAIPVKTYWMEHGEKHEGDARSLYEFKYEVKTESVGFVTNDAGTFGASPDCLVGANGLLEIKCPAPWAHIGYLTSNELDNDYKPQVQGQLFVTEREWSDWMSYHPDMPPVIIRTQRDEEYISALSSGLTQFCDMFCQRKEKLMSMGMEPKIVVNVPKNETPLDVFMAG